MANRYGLQPLLSDISFLMKDLSKIQRRAELLSEHAGITVLDDDSLKLYTGYRQVFVVKFYTSLQEIQTRSVNAVAYYNDYWDVGEFFWMVERLGLDAFAIPNLVWEMIPFSFVLDWFWNFGDWLRYHTPKWGRQVGATSVSITGKTEKITKIYKCVSIYGSASVTPPRGIARTTLKTINRYPNPVIDAGLHLTGESLSLNRKIDSLALAWQQAPSFFKTRS